MTHLIILQEATFRNYPEAFHGKMNASKWKYFVTVLMGLLHCEGSECGIFGTCVPPLTGHLPLVMHSKILYDTYSLSNEIRSLPGSGVKIMIC